jgi:hypothetical protein
MSDQDPADRRSSPVYAGHRGTGTLAALLLAATLPLCADAQLLSVPRMGVAGDWVKNLEVELDSRWEWVETAPDRVYFATALGAARRGEMVTMWLRVEYRDPQAPGNYLSVAEKNEWDCGRKRRSVIVSTMHRWNNLRDSAPTEAAVTVRTWEDIRKDTAGEALLDFACSLHPGVVRGIAVPATATAGPALPAATPEAKPAISRPAG